MFSLFSWITTSVREAVLAGFRQALEIVKSGQAGDSQEAKQLLALTAGQESHEPGPGQIEEGAGKRGKAKA